MLAIHALVLFALVHGSRVVRPPVHETVMWLTQVAPEAVMPPPPPPPQRPKHKSGPPVREAAAPPLRDIDVQPRTEIVATITDAPVPVAPAGGKPDGTGTAGAGDVGTGSGGAGGGVAAHVPVRVRALLDPDNCERPRWPAQATAMGLSGHVILAILVDVDGRVTDARVARSSGHAILDEAALDGVRRCQFVAATVDKAPVASWELFRYSWFNR